jgi:two-component system, OmpR family, alkaline phosphatase synthesis response regulator PhoP
MVKMDNNSGFKILIIDDEPDILEFLGYNLRKEGYQVFLANDGKRGIEQATEIKPHVILLDVMMPEMDGIQTCEQIRNTPEINNTLIAFLTARSEDYSQVAGFEAGGDDYIPKPIKIKVLISRIKALLRRYNVPDTTELQASSVKTIKTIGNITIDEEKYLVYVDQKEINLPRKEFTLLLLLTSRPSKVFTREEIFDFIWGDNVFVGDRTIDVYIRKLREKLGDTHIKTIKGVGYKFD